MMSAVARIARRRSFLGDTARSCATMRRAEKIVALGAARPPPPPHRLIPCRPPARAGGVGASATIIESAGEPFRGARTYDRDRYRRERGPSEAMLWEAAAGSGRVSVGAAEGASARRAT